jgi:hypothetical protein
VDCLTFTRQLCGDVVCWLANLEHEKIEGLLQFRVSFETSFDSKQPKLVSALSEKKPLIRLFCFYNETECFNVSNEPKQTEDQPKQFDREHICYFYRKFRVFPVFPFFFGFFHFFGFSAFFSKQYVSVVSLLFRNRKFRCFN